MRLSLPQAAGPRRILLVADSVGGVWQYSLELASGLVDHGVDVILAIAGPPPSGSQRDEAAKIAGLQVRVLEVGLDWQPGGEAQLALLRERLVALARHEQVELVHLNGAALGDLALGMPVVATQHSCLATWWQAMRPGTPLPAAWQWHRARVAAGMRAADAVIAPSAAFAAQLRKAYRPGRALDVIHNGRSARDFRPALRRQMVVLTAGRLWDEAKNLRTLDAAAGLRWPVLAAGPTSGPDDERGVDLQHVVALGTLGACAMRRRLSLASVFVSLALYEPFGLAVLEAALAGCALVLSDIPTFRELWDGAALFCAPDDAVAARAALVRVIDDRELRVELAASARQRALTYDSQACAEATLAVYRRLLAGSGGWRATA